MVRILEALGKDVLVCNAFAVPPNLRFLDPRRQASAVGRRCLGRTTRRPRGADRARHHGLGPIGGDGRRGRRRRKAFKVVIDHHVSGDDLGAELFKDAEAEATGRLVVEAADQLGVPLDGRRSPGPPSSPWPPTPAGSASVPPRPTRCGWPRGWSRPARHPDQLYKELYENDTHAPAATDRPGAGPHADRVGRPVDLHLARPGGFRRQRGRALRQRRHHQHDAFGGRHARWP